MYKKQVSLEDKIFSFFHKIEKNIKLPRIASAKNYDKLIDIYNSLPVELIGDFDIASALIARTDAENIISLFRFLPRELRGNIDIIRLIVEKIPVAEIDPETVSAFFRPPSGMVLNNLELVNKFMAPLIEDIGPVVPIIEFFDFLPPKAKRNAAVREIFAKKIEPEQVILMFKSLPLYMRAEPEVVLLFAEMISPEYVAELFSALPKIKKRDAEVVKFLAAKIPTASVQIVHFFKMLPEEFQKDINIIKLLVDKAASAAEISALFRILMKTDQDNIDVDVLRLFFRKGKIVALFNESL